MITLIATSSAMIGLTVLKVIMIIIMAFLLLLMIYDIVSNILETKRRNKEWKVKQL